ncbi:MAG: flagellar biosynthesis anti-sigma factor FlgM [Candidatus Binatia bacterium]
MKITPKGAESSDLAKIVRNDKKTAVEGTNKDTMAAQRSGESASVKISPEARELQRIAELARKGDQLRNAKVEALKEQIANGQYQVSEVEVAKSIARAEVMRLLEKK